jgi:hypothetical protein
MWTTKIIVNHARLVISVWQTLAPTHTRFVPLVITVQRTPLMTLSSNVLREHSIMKQESKV